MNNLKEFRKNKKVSQKDLSTILGMNIRLYQYYEADEREPAVRTAIRIARALDTTVEELFPIDREGNTKGCKGF